jgi:hypothetical protein
MRPNGSRRARQFRGCHRRAPANGRLFSTQNLTRRGKPLVRFDPIRPDNTSVWEDRVEYIAREGRWKEDFDVPSRDPQLPASPLDE